MAKLSYRERAERRMRLEGYEYAAGALLKGELTPNQLELTNNGFDENAFDMGVKEAVDRAVAVGLCKDDRV